MIRVWAEAASRTPRCAATRRAAFDWGRRRMARFLRPRGLRRRRHRGGRRWSPCSRRSAPERDPPARSRSAAVHHRAGLPRPLAGRRGSNVAQSEGTSVRAVVVGASSGLGRCIGIGLAQRGADVALLARRRERLEDAARRPAPARSPIECDVTDAASCRSAIGEAAAGLGGIDALVYTPGIGPLARLVDTDADTWRRVFDTNVTGAALDDRRRAPPPQRQRGPGRLPVVGERVADPAVARARRLRGEQGRARQAGRGLAGRAPGRRLHPPGRGRLRRRRGRRREPVRRRLGHGAGGRARAGLGRARTTWPARSSTSRSW